MSKAEFEKLWGVPITYGQIALCFVAAFLPSIVVGVADHQGWLVLSANRLQDALMATGAFFALTVYGALNKQRWTIWPLIATTTLMVSFIRNDGRLTREMAQRELMLLDVCAAPTASTELRARCSEAGVRPGREMCDFGKQPDECLRDLYRDAGWPQPTAPAEQRSASSEETSQ